MTPVSDVQKKEGKDVIRQISGIFFLITIGGSLTLAIILSFESPAFKIAYLVGKYKTSGRGELLWKIMFLGISSSIFLKSIFDQEVGIKVDLLESQKTEISISELFLWGFSFSTISGLIAFLLMNVLGNGIPAPQLLHEEDSLLFYYQAIVTAPIFEEFVFRFLLLLLPLTVFYQVKKEGNIRQIFQGKKEIERTEWISVALSASLFGLAHIGWINYWNWQLVVWKLLQATVMGVILGYSAVRYGIFSSMAIHWATNSIASIAVLSLILPSLEAFFLILVAFLFIFVLAGFGIADFVKNIKEKFERQREGKVSEQKTTIIR